MGGADGKGRRKEEAYTETRKAVCFWAFFRSFLLALGHTHSYYSSSRSLHFPPPKPPKKPPFFFPLLSPPPPPPPPAGVAPPCTLRSFCRSSFSLVESLVGKFTTTLTIWSPRRLGCKEGGWVSLWVGWVGR